MKRIPLIILLIFQVTLLPAQEQDTTPKMRLRIDEVIVTATRTKRKIQDIPAQVGVIGLKDIEAFPSNNIDDLLKATANVYVNRSWGIFSKNSSVTMHGLPGSSRILVLEDGVPKNKIAGGSVNWNNLNPDNIERIEIIKGPASSLYGNNAMGGVINIITKKPQRPFEGTLQTFYGSYNTLGGSVNLAGSEIKNDRGVYWNANGYYRRGDGYYLDPPEFLDPTDVRTYLREMGGSAMVGYQFRKSGNIDLSFDRYKEIRGAGQKIHVDDGSYESTLTSQVRTKYSGKVGQADVAALLYFADENFYGQKESLNETNEYRLLDSYTDKKDKGFWTTWSQSLAGKNYLTLGAELKSGDVVGEDIYRTSTDCIRFGSRMDILGFFAQDEISLINGRLKLIAGLRTDLVSFHDGHQSIIEPTKATGFLNGFSENFKDNRWIALSPKLALQYTISSRARVYISAGTGFIPPDLKDLSQTGKIRKGFRLANAHLKPEKLTNYELGYSLLFLDKIMINSSVYYSDGRDFQYMVGTGDSIDTGGGALKPILKPENIARIGIMGAECSAGYNATQNLSFNISYSYNHSRITQFGISDNNPDKDLTGKYMVEVSPHLFYAGMNYRYKSFSANVNCNYTGEQWFDDENTIRIDDFFVANLRISEMIKKHFKIYLDVQNLLNTEFIDRKGQLSPGRYITGGLQYNF